MVQRFAHLAAAPGAGAATDLPNPRLRIDPMECDRLIANLGLGRASRLTCFCPGAAYGPAKRWPAQYFGRLATALAAEGSAVWIVGSSTERDIGEAARAQRAGGALDRCG